MGFGVEGLRFGVYGFRRLGQFGVYRASGSLDGLGLKDDFGFMV